MEDTVIEKLKFLIESSDSIYTSSNFRVAKFDSTEYLLFDTNFEEFSTVAFEMKKDEESYTALIKNINDEFEQIIVNKDIFSSSECDYACEYDNSLNQEEYVSDLELEDIVYLDSDNHTILGKQYRNFVAVEYEYRKGE